MALPAAGSALADSGLPPQPYRYLHPPAALAGVNQPPTSLRKTLPVKQGTVQPAFLFVPDGQAGIGTEGGTFRPGAGVRSVLISIRPVESPPGLPSPLAVDGNAYSFSAQALPGNRPLKPSGVFTLTLRWPHLPFAVYRYSGGHWSRLCYADHGAIVTSSTISCRAHSFGIFAAVANSATLGTGAPTTPLSGTPLADLNRYIPFALALVVLLLTAILGYVISRPDKPAGTPSQ